MLGWVSRDGVPLLELQDAERKVRLSLTLDEDDSEPHLTLHDQAGAACVIMSVDEDGKPTVRVQNDASLWKSCPVEPTDGAGKKVA